VFLQTSSDIESVLESDAFESAARIVLVVLAALVLVWVLQRALTPLVRVAIREQMANEPELEVQKRIETLSHVIYRTLLAVVLAVVVVTILPEFGVNAAALIAGLGLFGLAIGFGAQNLVKDIINGSFILIENQYGVGDVVTVAGITGVVQDINLRRTILRDMDGVVHSVGHGQVDITSNWTKSFSRVNLNVTVSYATDLDTATEVIDRIGKELSEDPQFTGKIIDPPHVLRVDAFTDSGIELKIVGDTAPIEQWAVMGELRLRLKKAFDAEGIEIPYILRPLPMDGARFPAGNVASVRGAASAQEPGSGEC
jgi:small conductance mechanosensitive channel